MKILVIILIIVAIVQSIIFIWCDLLQYISKREVFALQESIKNIHTDFMREKERLRKMIDTRDKLNETLIKRLKDEVAHVELLEKELKKMDNIPLQSWQNPCANPDYPCSNPHHDCINCPRIGGGGHYTTNTGIYDNTIKEDKA